MAIKSGALLVSLSMARDTFTGFFSPPDDDPPELLPQPAKDRETVKAISPARIMANTFLKFILLFSSPTAGQPR